MQMKKSKRNPVVVRRPIYITKDSRP